MSQPPVRKRSGHQQQRALAFAAGGREPEMAGSSGRAQQARLDVLGYSPATDDLRGLYTIGDGLTRAEHASELNKGSQFARDNFERGATISGGVLSIPRDGDGRPLDAERIRVGSEAHAVAFVREIVKDPAVAARKGSELYAVAERACGQWTDSDGRLVVFKSIYDQVRRDERGNYRSREEKVEALDRVIEETARWAGDLPEPQPLPTAEEVHQYTLELAREAGAAREASDERDERESPNLFHEELRANSAGARLDPEAAFERGHDDEDAARLDDGAAHDEPEVYAELSEAGVSEAAELSREPDHLIAEERGFGGPALDNSYDRIALGDLAPAPPDGYVVGGELTDDGRRLFEEVLPRVDRAVEAGASRHHILDVIYRENAEADRAEHAERIAESFARGGGAKAGERGEPSREERLVALETLRALVGAEYLREARGHTREAVHWAREFDADNPSRYHTLFNPAGEMRPGALAVLKVGEREALRQADARILERRASEQAARGHAAAPSRASVGRLNEIERSGQRVVAMIGALRPTTEERMNALNIVGSRAVSAQLVGEYAIEEFEGLHRLAQDLRARLDRAHRGPGADGRLRDEAARAAAGVERSQSRLLLATGSRADTPEQARAAVGSHLRGIGATAAVVERNAARVGPGYFPRVSDEKATVFVSIGASSRERLPLGSVREYDALARAAGDARLQVTAWPGLYHSAELAARGSSGRAQEARFVAAYVDYRLQDHETRMLNERPLYRDYAARLAAALNPEELRAAAREIRKENFARDQEFKAHLADPENTRRPSERALPVHELRELFLSSPPEHYTPEMHAVKFEMSVMGREKGERTAALHRGALEPSQELRALIGELDTRQTEKALNHFYRSLRQPMDNPGHVDLRALHEGLRQYERDYLNDKISARYDALAGRAQPAPSTREDMPGAAAPERAEARAGAAADHAASQSYREYSGAAWWNEAQLLSLEEARLGGEPVESAGRSTIIPEATDRELLAAVYVLRNFNKRARADTVEHLKQSDRAEERALVEVITVLGGVREVSRQGDERVIAIDVPADSRLSNDSWERLMDRVQAGQEQPRAAPRVGEARHAEIRRESQQTAWERITPDVLREPGQILDAPAEVLHEALELRDEVGRAQGLQERARTAHYAAQGHVAACVARVGHAVADRAAANAYREVYRLELLNAVQQAMDRGDQGRGAAAMEVLRGEASPATRDARLSIASEASRVAEAAADRARASSTSQRETAVNRALVLAALDPSAEKAAARIIEDHGQRFELVKEIVTPEDRERHTALKSYASLTRDEYSRTFPELDQKRGQFQHTLEPAAQARREDAPERAAAAQSQRSPSMEEFEREVAARERDLLAAELREAIRTGQLPPRDDSRQRPDFAVRDLLPVEIRESARAAAREEAWLQLVPEELREPRAEARADVQVMAAAARVGDAVARAQGEEKELESVRQVFRGFVGHQVERAEQAAREERAGEAHRDAFAGALREVAREPDGDGGRGRAETARALLVVAERDGSQAPALTADAREGPAGEILPAAHASAERAAAASREQPLYNSPDEQLAATQEILSRLGEEEQEILRTLTERAADAGSRLEQSFVEIDGRREVLSAARSDAQAREKIEALRDISEPLTERVEAYVQTAARDGGVASLRDPERAEQHVRMLSGEIAACAEEHGVSLEKLNFTEEQVTQVARNFFGTFSESLEQAASRAQNGIPAKARDASLGVSQSLAMEQTGHGEFTHSAPGHVKDARDALGTRDEEGSRAAQAPPEFDHSPSASASERTVTRVNAEGFRGADAGGFRINTDSRIEHSHDAVPLMH